MMKLKTALRLPILSLVLLIGPAESFAQKNFQKPPAYQWLPFKWYGDNLNGKYFEKLAMLLPVKVHNFKGNVVAQFDLGSNATMLYGNSIKNYFGNPHTVYGLVDTSKKFISDAGIRICSADGMTIQLGAHQINHLLYAEYGDETPRDSLYTVSEKLVGTIGADFTVGKVLIIDFPNRKMCLIDTMYKYCSNKASFVDCRVKNSRIQLPVMVNGEIKWFVFDTGAGILVINTDKANWENIVGMTQ